MTVWVDDSRRMDNPHKTMIALKRFFKNPFLDPAISLTELQAFSGDHLAKVAAANTAGQFDAMLTDTGAAYTDYFGELANVSLRNALRQAATQEMELRWRELVKWVTSRGEARIIDRAGGPSAVYTEFFPAGKGEYHQATVITAQTLATRLKASAAEHALLLGADFKTSADGFADNYLQARELQANRKGEAADARGDRDADKLALQTQLFKNLLELALLEMDPEKCALYFSQHLLEDPDSAPEPEPEPGP